MRSDADCAPAVRRRWGRRGKGRRALGRPQRNDPAEMQRRRIDPPSKRHLVATTIEFVHVFFSPDLTQKAARRLGATLDFGGRRVDSIHQSVERMERGERRWPSAGAERASVRMETRTNAHWKQGTAALGQRRPRTINDGGVHTKNNAILPPLPPPRHWPAEQS